MDRVVSVFACLILLCSCARPESEEMFVKAASATDGVYTFRLDMSDTLATYDLSLYSRLDARRKVILGMEPILFDVSWKSPSDSVMLQESVYIVPEQFSKSEVLYRTAVKPQECGVWTLDFKPQNAPASMCGLGIISKRNDGTR